jgi:hypothetical protein
VRIALICGALLLVDVLTRFPLFYHKKRGEERGMALDRGMALEWVVLQKI